MKSHMYTISDVVDSQFKLAARELELQIAYIVELLEIGAKVYPKDEPSTVSRTGYDFDGGRGRFQSYVDNCSKSEYEKFLQLSLLCWEIHKLDYRPVPVNDRISRTYVLGGIENKEIKLKYDAFNKQMLSLKSAQDTKLKELHAIWEKNQKEQNRLVSPCVSHEEKANSVGVKNSASTGLFFNGPRKETSNPVTEEKDSIFAPVVVSS